MQQRLFFIVFKKITFDGVPKRMSEIQRFADAVLGGLLTYDLIFDFNRTMDQRIEIGVIQSRQIAELLPISRICNESVFEHLSKSRSHFVLRKRIEKRSIDDNQLRYIDHANLIFEVAQVDTVFTANRCVYHRKQRRGYMNERNTTLERRCDKTSQIGYNAAAKIQDHAFSVGSQFGQRVPYAKARFYRF